VPRRVGFAQSDSARPVPFVPVNRLAAIAVGGLLGSLARFGIAVLVGPGDPGALPVATLLANLVGALAIGVIATSRRVSAGPDWLRPFLITGVLGGFTTFSALALETGLLLDTGHDLMAAGYIGITMLFGLIAVRLGIRLARWAP
jgi:fluoride exporter